MGEYKDALRRSDASILPSSIPWTLTVLVCVRVCVFEKKNVMDQTWVLQPAGSTIIPTHEIRDCACRHYQLRYVAVELFMTNRSTIFVNWETQAKKIGRAHV